MADSLDPIYVTRPFLPPLTEFKPFLERIWATHELTNNGPLHRELELTLERYFDAGSLVLYNNGMSALLGALLSLKLTGSVITTPFTFAATTHAIPLCGLKPIFADISADDFNLSAESVERAIAPDTTAILAVHVYGRPCDIDGLADVARRHGLRLIYDASHAFAVKYRGRSILAAGDASTLSFHATKTYNTFEGGAVVSHDQAVTEQLKRVKNFGIAGEGDVPEIGFNGKMNEFQAAVGLAQLAHFDEITRQRRDVAEWYDGVLSDLPEVRSIPVSGEVEHNYSYYPVVLTDRCAVSRDDVLKRMARQNVFPRRYFYPLTSEFPAYRSLASADPAGLPNAHLAADRVLCLPLYPDLAISDRERVRDALFQAVRP